MKERLFLDSSLCSSLCTGDAGGASGDAVLALAAGVIGCSLIENDF